MKSLLILAWRNLWRNKRRSLITMSSVMFAVFLAILFFSMEQGTYERMIDSLVRYSTGYIQIQDVMYDEEPSMDHSMLLDNHVWSAIEKEAGLIDYTVPRIEHFALASSGSISRGGFIMGVDPDAELKLNDLPDRMLFGEFVVQDDPDIVVAEGLADLLRVEPGDSIVLLSQGYQGVTAAGIYRIKGIIGHSIPELNNSVIYMAMGTAQWFFGADHRVTSLIVMPHDPGQTNRIAQDIGAQLDQEWYQVLTWEDMLADLITLMQFDMAGTMVLLAILYIVIAFGLFGTILTMLMERKKEFGMLLALGMKRMQLSLICFAETLLISLAGAMAGILLAIPVIAYFYYFPIELSGNLAEALIDYGFEPILPFSTDPGVFISQARVILIISLGIGLYPIYSIFRLDMMKARQ